MNWVNVIHNLFMWSSRVINVQGKQGPIEDGGTVTPSKGPLWSVTKDENNASTWIHSPSAHCDVTGALAHNNNIRRNIRMFRHKTKTTRRYIDKIY